MLAHVPTLTVDPRKHLYVFGRIFRDTIRWKDFYNTMRTLVRRYPFRLANALTFEPFQMEGGLKRQHTVPYPAVVRREMIFGTAATSTTSTAQQPPPDRVRSVRKTTSGSSLPVVRPPFVPLSSSDIDVAALVEAYATLPLSSSSSQLGGREGGPPLTPFSPPRLECDPLLSVAAAHGADGTAGSGADLASLLSQPAIPPFSSFPASATLTLPAGCSARSAMGAVRLTRPLLAAFVGTAKGSNPLRTAALRQLYGCASCAVFDPTLQWNNMAHSHFGVLWAYRNAVFCVQPPGNSPSRKGFFDALLLGCIPVIVDGRGAGREGGTGGSSSRSAEDTDDTNSGGGGITGDSGASTSSGDGNDDGARTPMVLPYAWAISWRDVALVLPANTWRRNLIATLRNQSAVDIRARQARLAAIAPLVQWDWSLLSLRALARRALTGAATYRAAVGGGEGTSSSVGGVGGAGGVDNGVGSGGGACARDAMDMLLATLHRRSPRRADEAQPPGANSGSTGRGRRKRGAVQPPPPVTQPHIGEGRDESMEMELARESDPDILSFEEAF